MLETKERPKVKTADIKWETVAEAAGMLKVIADNSIWRPPEAWQALLEDAVYEMNRIAEALCFTAIHNHPDKKG